MDGAEVPEILLVEVGVALVLQHAGPVLLSAAGQHRQVTPHSGSDISESILKFYLKGTIARFSQCFFC